MTDTSASNLAVTTTSNLAISTETTTDLSSQADKQGITLNADQVRTGTAIIKWLSTPADKEDFGSVVQVLSSAAGTGKTFLVDYVIEYAIHTSIISSKQAVWGTAPLHKATHNLAAHVPGIRTSTIHSLLKLMMKEVEFSDAEHHQLEVLDATYASGNILTPAEESRRNLLTYLEEAAQAKEIQLVSKLGIVEFAEQWWDIDLLIIDEAFLMNTNLCNLLFKHVIYNDYIRTPKILCLGDIAQLPPVGEKLSVVSTWPMLPELRIIERQKGILQKYVSEIREVVMGDRSKAYLTLAHHPLVNKTDDMILAPESVVMQNLTSILLSVGTDYMSVVSTSNARVDELNESIYRQIRVEKGWDDTVLPFHVGDTLMTRSVITRYQGKPGSNKGMILFLGSSPITVVDLVGSEVVELVTGDSVRVYECLCAEDGGDEDKPVLVVHPLDWATWRQAEVSIWDGRKAMRNKGGKAAEKVFQMAGLKSWSHTKTLKQAGDREHAYRDIWRRWQRWTESDYRYPTLKFNFDMEIDAKQKKSIGYCLSREAFSVRQIADKISCPWASTTHTLQGRTIPIVVMDLARFLPRTDKYAGSANSTWDSYRTWYSAASRVGKRDGRKPQLIFMTPG